MYASCLGHPLRFLCFLNLALAVNTGFLSNVCHRVVCVWIRPQAQYVVHTRAAFGAATYFGPTLPDRPFSKQIVPSLRGVLLTCYVVQLMHLRKAQSGIRPDKTVQSAKASEERGPLPTGPAPSSSEDEDDC